MSLNKSPHFVAATGFVQVTRRIQSPGMQFQENLAGFVSELRRAPSNITTLHFVHEAVSDLCERSRAVIELDACE